MIFNSDYFSTAFFIMIVVASIGFNSGIDQGHGTLIPNFSKSSAVLEASLIVTPSPIINTLTEGLCLDNLSVFNQKSIYIYI